VLGSVLDSYGMNQHVKHLLLLSLIQNLPATRRPCEKLTVLHFLRPRIRSKKCNTVSEMPV